MNVDLFDLERFVKVQNAYDSYDIALQEVKNERKESHWMWYIFPQVQGLGHSNMSQRYSIKSFLEAKAFLEDDTLGKRPYEVMSALPVYGDAEDIFGALGAMRLRSCLTLFDLISPDDIFLGFLENYFNRVRCQKTLKVAASELSYYKEDNAFQRNGIHEPARAFFESGTYEAEQIDYGQKIGTLWDLSGRGETMRKLLSQYFWRKDFSVYRVSGVRFTMLGCVRTVFRKIADNVHDDSLFEEMNGIYNQYQPADDDSMFLIVDAIDEFVKTYCDDKDIKSVLDMLIKHSLCLLIVKYDERAYNGVICPKHTLDTISSLKSDEIFVFGSNLHGHRGGGAARAACKKFSAIWRQGAGLQGQSYAIPTMQGGVEAIKPYVDQFIEFAKEHTELFFYVACIGCGIADFKDSDMASLFREAIGIKNVCLPKSLW